MGDSGLRVELLELQRRGLVARVALLLSEIHGDLGLVGDERVVDGGGDRVYSGGVWGRVNVDAVEVGGERVVHRRSRRVTVTRE